MTSSETFATIFTPQGDGNRCMLNHQGPTLYTHSPRYLPRKGTETDLSDNTSLHWIKNSPRYLPRKGTETAGLPLPVCWLHFQIRHDIYPARGRKLERPWGELTRLVYEYSPRYLPRKGTETSTKVAYP